MLFLLKRHHENLPLRISVLSSLPNRRIVAFWVELPCQIGFINSCVHSMGSILESPCNVGSRSEFGSSKHKKWAFARKQSPEFRFWVQDLLTLLERNVNFDTMLPCVTFLAMVTRTFFEEICHLLGWFLRQGYHTGLPHVKPAPEKFLLRLHVPAWIIPTGDLLHWMIHFHWLWFQKLSLRWCTLQKFKTSDADH